MTQLLAYGIVGLFGGLHSSSWGAYKDTPHEEFKVGKFLRSIAVGLVLGLLLFQFLKLNNIYSPNPGLFFLFVMAFERLYTESLKLFVRVENQDKYHILQTFHWLGNVVNSRLPRLGMGVVFVALAFGWFYLPFSITLDLPQPLLGLVWGTVGGLGIAICGAWKDAPIEGFEPSKFMRSPFVGALWGLLFSAVTSDYSLLLFACIGGERMTVELYKTFIRRKHAKFSAPAPRFPEWMEKRKRFIVPYLLTWALFFVLLVRFRPEYPF